LQIKADAKSGHHELATAGPFLPLPISPRFVHAYGAAASPRRPPSVARGRIVRDGIEPRVPPRGCLCRPYAALATDYDGTIAHDGVVDEPTRAALERLKAAQRRLILVTGREMPGLERVLPDLERFDGIVAEDGALLVDPTSRTRRPLAPPPPPEFAERLRARGVNPLSVGEGIVATWEPNETAVLETKSNVPVENEGIQEHQ
jgi:haloacid dehalogenase-like hydrolase